MHLTINNALLWDQKVMNWRDLEIIKGAGLVLRPTSVQCESVCGWQGPQDLGLALILQNSCSGGGRWLMWPPLWQSCLPKIDRGGPEVYYCVYWIFYDKSLSGQDFQLWHAWEFVKIWGVFSPLIKDMNNMDCYIHFYRGPCSLLRPTLVWHK